MTKRAAWLAAPQLILTAALALVPLGHAVLLAFTTKGGGFVGLGNFVAVLGSPAFWVALKNTGMLMMLIVPTQTVLAFVLACAIVESRAYGFRAVFYFPEVTSGVVLAIVMRRVFDPVSGLFGAQVMAGHTAIVVLACSVFLISFGTPLLIYVAAVKGVPREIVDAAQIDGVGRIGMRWRILFPTVRHTTYLVILLKTIAVSQAWVVVQLMTGGGPARSTETLSYQIYHEAFRRGEFNRAAAIGMVLLCVVALLGVAQRRVAQD